MERQKKICESDMMVFPGSVIPSFRTQLAIQNKVNKNLLLHVWGGLGDQVCAEPTLRFAFKSFKDCDISLSSDFPDLFSHLPFKNTFNISKKEIPKWDDYMVFHMIMPPPHLNWEFISHSLINCVDYPAINAFRMQLPVADRELYLTGKCPENISINFDDSVFIHAGKHWQSKTFPKKWWDEVIDEILFSGLKPVLIGADSEGGKRGTVDVNPLKCCDLRNELSIQETTWLLQRAKVLLTNDSSPLHLAASTDPEQKEITGHCWIGYIATCKHPDFITHFRKGQWQYREVNHGSGGVWDYLNYCPNQDEEVMIHKVEPTLLESWLPDPKKYAGWACEKFG